MSSALSPLLCRFCTPRAGALVGAFALAAGLGACSASLDFTECASDDDCAGFYEDNKPMRCADNVCVVRAGGCEANSQCEGLGEAFICTNSASARVCAATETDQCGAPIYPDGEASDDVVFVGVMMPKEGADAELGAAMEKAALAAIADFNASAKLQGGNGVAVVACDTKGDIEQAVSAATHLGETLTIPVFIGPLDDLEFTMVVDQVTLANRVNAFTAGPMITADLTELDPLNLVYLTMPGAVYQGRAMGQRIGKDFEGAVGNPSAIVLLAQNAYGFSMYDGVATEPVEGKPNRIPEIAGSQYIASYKSLDTAKEKLDTALSTGFDDASMLIVLGRHETAEILQHYAASGTPWPERVYVTHRAMPGIAELADTTLGDRIIAVAPKLETAKLEALRDRLGDPDLPPEAGLAYDAAMTALLGMAAVKASEPVVGPRIAGAMARLTDKAGAAVDFGLAPADFIPAAVAALAAGQNLDVAGISGPLDFDAKGAVCGDAAAYRLDASATAWEAYASFTTDCPNATGAWDN